MTRDEINKKSIRLAKENKILALEFATGVGKSKIALDIINSLFITSVPTVLLVVAELAHFDNWKKEAFKWKHDKLWDTITCVTYASLKKHKDMKYDIIILDEAHHIGSDLRLDVIDNIQFDKMLLLSATLGGYLKQYMSNMFNTQIKSYEITLQQAIDWGILPKPKIYLIPLTLNTTNVSEKIIEEWGKAPLRKRYKCTYQERWEYIKNKKKYPNVILEISCTPYQKYIYLTEKFEYFKKFYFRNRNEAVKNKWLQLGSQRKRFMSELKTPIVKKFLNFVTNSRYICFCGSIEQADILGKNNSIHSKKDNSAEIIDKFNNKEINNLFAVGMLQEGQNLNDIEVGIIVQLDGQERSFIQKFGRSLRAEDPVQYIFYYKNTRDTEYLQNALEGIDKNYIQELNYENNIT